MALSPTEARELLAAVTTARTHDDAQAAAAQALNFLLRQLEELRDLANGYPRNPISGAVWADGKDLTEVCDALTDAFSSRGLTREGELASRLATGMACQVMSHYPEEIFPRVLRNSRCRETIDQLDQAIGGYEAIVSDFKELGLDDLLEDEEPLDGTSRAILASVYDAAKRLGELQPERIAELHGLKAKLEGRLAQGR